VQLVIKYVNFPLFRGPQPDTPELKEALKADVQTVLSLQSGIYSRVLGRTNQELEWATDRGITAIHLELSPFFRPKLAALKTAVKIIKQNRSMVYVHCRQGVDRTGLVVAAYRMLVQGWTLEQSKKEMLDAGFHLYRYWWWLPILKKVAGTSLDPLSNTKSCGT